MGNTLLGSLAVGTLAALIGWTPLAGAADPVAPDLSHVKVNQKYLFQQNALLQVWTVRAVGRDFVNYELIMLLDGNPVGDPKPQQWKYTPSKPPPGTPPTIKRDTITISGIAFDCIISESAGYRSWMTMTKGSDSIATFPGLIRTQHISDNVLTLNLVRIQ